MKVRIACGGRCDELGFFCIWIGTLNRTHLELPICAQSEMRHNLQGGVKKSIRAETSIHGLTFL